MEIDEEEPPANIKKGQWSQNNNEDYGHKCSNGIVV